MNQALAKAIKLNRQIEQANTCYAFEVVSSKEEEQRALDKQEPNVFLTLLRLYETDGGDEDNMDLL